MGLSILACMMILAVAPTGPASAGASGALTINGDDALLQMQLDEGWSGSGAEGDPIVITGYEIDAAGAGHGLRIEGTTLHVVVRSCTFENADDGLLPYEDGYGLLILNAQNVDVEDCQFSAVLFGIGIISSSQVSVTGCSGTVDADGTGILVDTGFEVELSANAFSTLSSGASIAVRNSQYCMLVDNNVTNANAGLVLEDSSFVDAVGTESYGNQHTGVSVTGCDNVSVSWSIIENVTNNHGILVEQSEYVILHNNTVSDTGYYAVYVLNSHHCALHDNVVSLSGQGYLGGGDGMWLGGSHFLVSRNRCFDHPGHGMFLSITEGTVSQNQLADNNGGMYVVGSSELLIEENDIVSSGIIGIDVYESAGVRLAGNVIDGQMTEEGGAGIGIRVMSSQDIEIIQNYAAHFDTGIEIAETSGIWVEGNDCSGSFDTGIDIRLISSLDRAIIENNDCLDCGQRGIMLSGGSYCVIEGNDCSYSPYGIFIYASYLALVGNNTCLGSESALYLHTADGTTVWGGTYGESIIGIDIYGCTGLLLESVVASYNLNAGLYLIDASSCQFLNCTFSWNGVGIDASYVPDENSYPRSNHISGCKIENNTECGVILVEGRFNHLFENHFANNEGYAIQLSQCSICYIYNNTFLDNNGASAVDSSLRQAYTEDGEATWYWSTANGAWGNRWSNLKNLDADGDGIVDADYRIGSPYGVTVYDRYPLPYGPKIEAPSAPTDLSASAFKGRIELAWSEPALSGNSTLAGYIVYRGEYPDFSSMWEVETCYDASFTDISYLVNGQTYYYAIVCWNEDGFYSEPSIVAMVHYQPFPLANHAPIVITSNEQFDEFASSGDGTALDPYVIRDLIIDGSMYDACIRIVGTTAHFVILDCHLYFSSGVMWGSGSCIVLMDLANGRVEGCLLEEAPEKLISIASSSVSIADCIFSGPSNVALELIDSPYCSVTGCTIGQYYGIYASGSAGCDLSGNTFIGTGCEYMYALYLHNSPECTISGNTMLNGSTFVYLSYGDGCVITDNHLSGSAQSFVNVYSSTDVLIAHNTMVGPGLGVAITLSTTACTVEGNHISYYATGIRVAYPGNVIANNTCTLNGVGIWVSDESIMPSGTPGNRVFGNVLDSNTGHGLRLSWGVSGCEVFNNRFIDNGGYGILVEEEAYENLFYLNCFEGNNGATGVFSSAHRQSSDLSYANAWSLDGLGNYWSDWTAPDEDGDGIVDLPYPIAEGVSDDAPLASLWGATRSLSMAVGPVFAELTWGDVVYDFTDGIEGYVIYRGTASGSYEEVGRSSSRRYTDTNVSLGVTYYYRVAAYRGAVVGPLGPEVSGRPCDVPAAPSGAEAERGIGELHLSWSAPGDDGGSEVLGYTIWRGASMDSLELYATLGTVTSFVDDGLGVRETYYYAVKAFNAAGNGTASAVFSATTYGMPSEPGGVVAQFGDGSVLLAWSAPGDDGGLPVLGYVVRWTTDPLGTWTAVDVGLELSYHHTGLTNGLAYYYTVSAVNAVGEGASSDEVDEVPARAPGAPPELGLVQDDGAIELSWLAPASDGGSVVIRYAVYRGLAPGALEHIGDAAGRSYVDINVTNGVVYFYEVRAVNKAGEGTGSASIRGTPGLPMGPTGLAADVVDGAVHLSWSAPSDSGSPLIDYKVYRRGPDGVERFIGSVGNGTWTAFVDHEVHPGTAYQYRVSAVTARGEGDPSGIAAAAVPDSAPLPPVGLAVEEADGVLVLTWSAAPFSAAADDYWIYRGTASGALAYFAHTGSGSVLRYEDTTAVPGTTYYYEVRAMSSLGVSEASAEVSSEVPEVLPSAPRDLVAEGGDGTVVLTWSAPGTGAPFAAYRIYRGTSDGAETLLDTIAGRFFVDEGLTNGVTYYYRVSAVNQFGEGPNASVSATPLTVPSAPRDLAAAGGTGNVTLTWSAPLSDGGSAVLGYMVYRVSGTGAAVYLATLDGTAYIDEHLANGTRYAYQVRAFSAVGLGGLCAAAGATTWDVPSSVTALHAAAGVRSVALSWSLPLSDGGTEVLGYRVYRNGALAATVTALSFQDTELENGASYLYTVVAFNAMGDAPAAAVVAATPALPGPVGGLTAEGGNGQVTLRWTAPAGGASGYAVYRGTSPGDYTSVVHLSAAFLIDEGLANGVVYYYAVAAVNAAGEGAMTVVEASPATVPGVPRDLVAVPGDGLISLTWDAPAGDGGSAVTAYRVYRAAGTGPWAHLSTVAGLGYDDGSALAGMSYRYRVSAVSPIGEGDPSAAAEAELEPATGTTPGAPSMAVEAKDGGILLTWAEPSDSGSSAITAYRIYRGTGSGGMELIATVPSSSTSYSDAAVVAGQEYSYWVVAENAAGAGDVPASAASAVASVGDGGASADGTLPVLAMALGAAGTAVALVAMVMVLRKK